VTDRTQYAGNVPAEELAGDDSLCPVCHSAATRLDPINTATGAYERQDTDVTLAGEGVPFSLARSYSSDNEAVGLFGSGWSANLTSSLTVLDSGDVEATAGTGAVVDFVKQSDGTYLAPPEVRAELVALPGGGWQIETTNQMLSTYSSTGQLLSQVDRNDKGLTYSYDDQGRLATVTDSAGQTATLSYGTTDAATNMVTGVELSDGRSWSYGYDYAPDGTTPLLTMTALIEIPQ
jgi:YD repeat-containing protein